MINSTEVIIPTLVNFSTFGFLIILGLATFIPMAYDSILNEKSGSAVQHYPIRLTSRLANVYSVSCLLVLSLVFVLIGLSGLLYFISGHDHYVKVALYLAITVLILLLLFISSIAVSAISYNKKELTEIVDFMNSAN